MLIEDEGFVIRRTKYGEKSIISKVLTKENGLVDLIYSLPRKRKPNLFQPLNCLNLVFYPSKKTTIHRVKEVTLNLSPLFSDSKIEVNSLVFFIAEFLDKTIKEEGKNEWLYLFIKEQLQFLYHSSSSLANYHIRFIYHLLPYLGIEPNIKEGDDFFDMQAGHSNKIADNGPFQLEKDDFELLKKLLNDDFSFTKNQRNKVLDILMSYIEVQTGCKLSSIKSRDVLKVILE